ncbi:MAG: CRISPR-associated endonuclease Cas2 [Deltaproteobacteria bacterium]|nr:CRISPR-associated endonuclease Cas2 [Deltaproteobacteria bacterium]
MPDDKQRTKLAKTIKDFGDRVRIYCLCANCEKEIRIMGKGKVTKE